MNSSWSSHVMLKDFNFLSKYAVFSYSHSSNVVIVNTFKKQCIFFE